MDDGTRNDDNIGQHRYRHLVIVTGRVSGGAYLNKLADDKANWEQIKAGYKAALDTLDGIISQPMPQAVNLTVIQTMTTAIQNEARILKQLLHYEARR